jgi:hypothetical protein
LAGKCHANVARLQAKRFPFFGRQFDRNLDQTIRFEQAIGGQLGRGSIWRGGEKLANDRANGNPTSASNAILRR